MQDNNLKPFLNYDDMIICLKKKNIKFDIVNEEKAKKYLKDNNNYYNVTSYKNNFKKYYKNGNYIDEYIDLDFAYLKDLSIIDYYLRMVLFKMVANIEHYLKIRILNIIHNTNIEDGYVAVNEYLDLDYNSIDRPKRLHNSIINKVGTEYYEKIFSKYDIDGDKKLENIPIWEFMEIITFGELIDFYEFFTHKYNIGSDYKYFYVLREVKKIRNAVAHNTPILNNVIAKNNNYKIDYFVNQFLSNCKISDNARKKRMENNRIRQITYTIYLHSEFVTSSGVRSNVLDDLKNIINNRSLIHKKFYKNNQQLQSIYKFFKTIINSID